MQAEHRPFRMSWADSKFARADTSVRTHSTVQMCFSLFTGSTELILEVTPEDVNFACSSDTGSQDFLNQSKVTGLDGNMITTVFQAKHWCCWLLSGGGSQVLTLSSPTSAWLRKEEPWDVLYHFRCLNRLPGPTPQMPAEALRNGPQHQPQPQSPRPALLSTASIITFLQLIHQHSLLPVFRGCTLFFLLGY